MLPSGVRAPVGVVGGDRRTPDRPADVVLDRAGDANYLCVGADRFHRQHEHRGKKSPHNRQSIILPSMPFSFAAAVLVLTLAQVSSEQQGPHLTVVSPVTTGSGASVAEQQAPIDVRRLDAIEPLVHEAIADRKLPGAVVLVGRGDRILYQKAIGNRAVTPSVEPMTLDTIFDLASLTKVVATTTSVMMLVEQGRIRLSDRVHRRARLRALRQGRHYDPTPADACFGAAARRRSRGAVDGLRDSDRTRCLVAHPQLREISAR